MSLTARFTVNRMTPTDGRSVVRFIGGDFTMSNSNQAVNGSLTGLSPAGAPVGQSRAKVKIPGKVPGTSRVFVGVGGIRSASAEDAAATFAGTGAIVRDVLPGKVKGAKMQDADRHSTPDNVAEMLEYFGTTIEGV